MASIPDLRGSEETLEQLLSIPYPETVEMMKRLEGDLLILGVGGKIGPSLAATAANACAKAGVQKRIIGVDKVLTAEVTERLTRLGVETQLCDLSEYEQVNDLPRVRNVIFMAGRKFGQVGSEPLTWLMNAVIPGNVGQAFRGSRIVVFSTGCVYELVSTDGIGSLETDRPKPVGEYANSCLGRERVFEYYCSTFKTPVLLFRLNYAVDLRYGVIVEIAKQVYDGKPVDITVNAANVIWQGDAVNRALLCLEHTSCPAAILNITGRQTLRVDAVAQQFGQIFRKTPSFCGSNSGKAYLSNADRSFRLFGLPRVTETQMIQMVAEWMKTGGAILDKPTHFNVTDGQFLDGGGKA
ncbi:MAG TPA: epimerase [bacterium]|nr:epimerase [bacterium]